MPKISIKFQIASQAVCAYAHNLRKRPGCALIGACALIRTNTVITTKWGNRMKRKYIYISKQKSEIVSGSVNIQNDLFFSAFK